MYGAIECIDIVYTHIQSVCRLIHSSDLQSLKINGNINDAGGIQAWQQKCSKDWTDSDEYLREAMRCGLKGKNACGKHKHAS